MADAFTRGLARWTSTGDQSKGSGNVGQRADMQAAQDISDAVPRNGLSASGASDARDRQTVSGSDHTKTHDPSSAPDNTEGPE